MHAKENYLAVRTNNCYTQLCGLVALTRHTIEGIVFEPDKERIHTIWMILFIWSKNLVNMHSLC